MRRFLGAAAGAVLIAGALLQGASAATAAAQRVKVTGEVIDSWCQVSGIMFATGTAHHQCAIWCAVGGVPVGLFGDDGKVYIILKVEADDTSVANPRLLEVQTNKLVVDGDLIERDGVNYLLISKIVDNQGIVNLTHAENGIQPFGE